MPRFLKRKNCIAALQSSWSVVHPQMRSQPAGKVFKCAFAYCVRVCLLTSIVATRVIAVTRTSANRTATFCSVAALRRGLMKLAAYCSWLEVLDSRLEGHRPDTVRSLLPRSSVERPGRWFSGVKYVDGRRADGEVPKSDVGYRTAAACPLRSCRARLDRSDPVLPMLARSWDLCTLREVPNQ